MIAVSLAKIFLRAVKSATPPPPPPPPMLHNIIDNTYHTILLL